VDFELWEVWGGFGMEGAFGVEESCSSEDRGDWDGGMLDGGLDGSIVWVEAAYPSRYCSEGHYGGCGCSMRGSSSESEVE
jgi:hypothetical protein